MRGAEVAEFSAAAACHVAAALLQVDDLGAPRACLPVLLMRQSLHHLNRCVLASAFARMGDLLAGRADFRSAARTCNIICVIDGRAKEQ
jgi:hypothetical protein